MPGVAEEQLASVVMLASLADETPEGRSIIALAKGDYGVQEPDLTAKPSTIIPFAAQTRLSGIDIDGRSIRKGAVDSIVSCPAAYRCRPHSIPAGGRQGRAHRRHTAGCGKAIASLASSTSRTWSSPTSRSALPNCVPWAFAP